MRSPEPPLPVVYLPGASGRGSALRPVIDEATHDLEEEFPDLLASLVEAHLRA